VKMSAPTRCGSCLPFQLGKARDGGHYTLPLAYNQDVRRQGTPACWQVAICHVQRQAFSCLPQFAEAVNEEREEVCSVIAGVSEAQI